MTEMTIVEGVSVKCFVCKLPVHVELKKENHLLGSVESNVIGRHSPDEQNRCGGSGSEIKPSELFLSETLA